MAKAIKTIIKDREALAPSFHDWYLICLTSD